MWNDVTNGEMMRRVWKQDGIFVIDPSQKKRQRGRAIPGNGVTSNGSHRNGQKRLPTNPSRVYVRLSFMPELTLNKSAMLPPICVVTGREDGLVKRMETVTYRPETLWWLRLLPIGGLSHAALQSHQERFIISYYVAQEIDQELNKRSLIQGVLMLFVLVPLFLIPLIKWLWVLLISIAAGVAAHDLRKKCRPALTVVKYTSNTITLGGLPENLVAAYQKSLPPRPFRPSPRPSDTM
ncbi:MAG: hypothetical protein K8R23_18655 [Chthoniobacter sp.]|nr:hypothetical protein [Chthoniobacter sp.]